MLSRTWGVSTHGVHLYLVFCAIQKCLQMKLGKNNKCCVIPWLPVFIHIWTKSHLQFQKSEWWLREKSQKKNHRRKAYVQAGEFQ